MWLTEKLFVVVCFEENRFFLEIYVMNEETVNEKVRLMRKRIQFYYRPPHRLMIHLRIHCTGIKEVSVLMNFGLHPPRFVGARLYCIL